MNKSCKIVSVCLLLLKIISAAPHLSAQNILPVDPAATKETQILYSNMQKLAQNKVIFGPSG